MAVKKDVEPEGPAFFWRHSVCLKESSALTSSRMNRKASFFTFASFLQRSQGQAALAIGDGGMIDSLPDDCLRQILLKLESSQDRSSFSLVCKRWKFLEATAHEGLKFQGGRQFSGRLKSALSRFQEVKELEISEKLLKGSLFRNTNASQKSLSKALQEIASSCPELQRLVIHSCPNLTDSALSPLSLGCPKLRTLRLVECEKAGTSTKPNTEPLLSLGGLKELDLPFCKGLSGGGLERLLEGCGSHLVQLNLYGTALDDVGLSAIGKLCRGLERLSIAGCLGVTDGGVKALAEGCENLQDLNIAKCSKLTNGAFEAIAGSGKKLRLLTFGWHKAVTDLALINIGANCKMLEFLSITDCPEVREGGVRAIVKGCSSLQVLKLTLCPEIGNVAVEAIAKYGKRLQVLELRGATLNDFALWILSGMSVCMKLERLVLAGCPHIGDAGLMHLARGSLKLKSVDIRRCRGVTTEGLARLMLLCASLEQVDVDKARTAALDAALGITRPPPEGVLSSGGGR